MKGKPNILICPLDWGIGHATRCIPIINELIHQNANVIIGADNQALELLKQEFPQLQSEIFPGYKFSYPDDDKMALKMAKQTPAFISGIKSENRLLNDFIKKLNIDAVISDNRFGLYNKDVPSIFISHQINIQVPDKLKFLEPILYKINKNFILKYTECWIPDWEDGFTLSGELSHKKSKLSNTYFIGPISRFWRDETLQYPENYINDFVIVVSGPEPQRTLFETSILDQLKTIKGKGVVVLGRPELTASKYQIGDHITVYSHLGSKELETEIRNSKTVVSRPGYSTVMDLVALGKQAVFIPTPGQTEQEYLADYFYESGKYLWMRQQNFDLMAAFDQANKFPGFKRKFDQFLLKERISNLLRSI